MNPAPSDRDFNLGIHGFRFSDLFDPARLRDLYHLFEGRVASADPELARAWSEYARGECSDVKKISNLIINKSRHLSVFIAELFDCEDGRAEMMETAAGDTSIFRFKRDFVKRRVFSKFKEGDAVGDAFALRSQVVTIFTALGIDGDADDEAVAARASLEIFDLRAQLAGAKSAAALKSEGEAARLKAQARAGEIQNKLSAARADVSELEIVAFLDLLLDSIERWIFARYYDSKMQQKARRWLSYHQPRNLDYQHLVEVERPRADLPELFEGPEKHRRERDGFQLTDRRWDGRRVLGETHYCLLCHDRDKDSCSKGFVASGGGYTTNPLGVPLAGCPLDEKISEMHVLRREGDSIGALAIITLDNPMCPGTGHRICNDCMKGCIFQKQEPVNIPQIETGVLTDVLQLPYGFEIYGLLTRWNPLDTRRPYLLPYNGKNIMIVGLGPAGYTLAHYCIRDGFGVVGVDGLKIEPLPAHWTGADGKTPSAIKNYKDLEVDLAGRALLGFGGVSEYGITVRWDKNFLTVIYLTLARHRNFKVYGGVRFGGTLTLDDAWKLGFDHVAVAAGAGKPTIVEFENNLVRGVRKASDFLMALQLTGAYRRDSLANLQVRLPAVVIGGGLTAIDTATELLAYYVVQVEKVLERFEALAEAEGENVILQMYDAEEREILQEALDHGRAVREERRAARAAGREPRFQHLLNRWGGVSLAYRRTVQESPAYRLNHEEVEKCLEEGVRFIEKISPRRAVADMYGALASMEFTKTDAPSEIVTLPARTVCVAAGTSPNTTYERELPGTFGVDVKKGFFKPHRVVKGEDGKFILQSADASAPGAFFTSYDNGDGKFVSYYGDNHPKYAGSVVKAMASARDGEPFVYELFKDEVTNLNANDQPARDGRWSDFITKIDDALLAKVVEVRRLTPTIIEVIVRAPFAARGFRPGQFYRLQNYEMNARRAHIGSSSALLTMEGIALTGAWNDPERGLLSLIILEMGVSSRLCALLKPGEPVVVMGPTGAPTEIPRNETVVLCGGGLGNAVLFSIAKALKNNNCKVIYFAGYKKSEDVFKRDEIEAATDQVVWSTDAAPSILPRRPRDRAFIGNIVQSMLAFARGELGEIVAPLSQATRMIVIGSDRMMAAVARARHESLRPYLNETHTGIGSINSPMQCMMKEVCAQCLQRHVDPKTGKEFFVFSCFNQDQHLDFVDWKHLAARLRQNTVQEKLTNRWLTKALEKVRPVSVT